MDLFDFLLQLGLIASVLVAYLLLFKKPPNKKGPYNQPGWSYPIKKIFAWYTVRGWKKQLPIVPITALPVTKQIGGWDAITVRAAAPDGSTVFLGIRKWCERRPLAEVTLFVKLPDGTYYQLPRHPDTAIGTWESTANGWVAEGLKIQVLDPENRLRILYNGLLTRVGDNVTQHAKLNLIWSPGSEEVRYPNDWDSALASDALALEAISDGWSDILSKWEQYGWLHWGSVQGRFQSYTAEGTIDQSVYLQTRGLSERRWAPQAYQGLRRSVMITAAVKDGVMVQLRALSYRNVLTKCISGCVRFPNFLVNNISATDLVLSHFGEHPDCLPSVYTINVTANNRDLKLVLRINDEGGTLLSGVPYQHETVFRTAAAEIDGVTGAAILEFGYEPRVSGDPSIPLTQPPLLKLLSEKEAGEVGYCLSFEARASACPEYVGGKGASLSLLASLQKEQGYRVPPGFCLTTKALEKHLERNPKIRTAILEIEAANENYEEAVFKEKCAVVTSLFASTSIAEEVKQDILDHMSVLRKQATEQSLGPELRFAVRSSAVGEDSEVLSAAGQNETVLGCASDDDVLSGVQKCWGSMFAFTSAYYRRQNGQPCLCGGGVVVQALVRPRAAGVMFTRHPDAGDPTRLLITANYGLGESVVSGTVEPDTIIVRRHTNGSLSIFKTDLGSKTSQVTATPGGVEVQEVSEGERNRACLSDEEALRLAKIGVTQEALWGAGRDIEWAVRDDEVFLLQARPITSLERWTEEELLHEFDMPILADDEILSFGNTGEVLPRPISAMGFDFVTEPLSRGVSNAVGSQGFDLSIGMTHNRLALILYNSIYKRVPAKLDTNTQMVEMAIHGHTVADQHIFDVAGRRRAKSWSDSPILILKMLKTFLSSKRCMTETVKRVDAMSVGEGLDDPRELFKAIVDLKNAMEEFSYNHAQTSSSSTASNMIALSILMEGKSDFTPELCNEISVLLSSGDVLSAEVPHALNNLARDLETSGRVEEFRALDPKLAMVWLQKNLPHIHLNVTEFLRQHGHRAIMEFDVYTKPWVLVPEEMMKVLQNLRASNEKAAVSKTDAEIVASLKSPSKASTRRALRWVMPLCRRSIRHREATKAHMILAIHKFRLAMLRLGRLLAREWYLPHEDLVFFFRAHELQAYLETRDPALLRKAAQRHQYYPKWCKIKFEEINTGWVTPLEIAVPAGSAGDVRMNATTVCAGEVVARACVVKDLSEIGQLQQGDVLITHATDIGWSPYFPLLSGIVTELGGLISHGAVIAREYGLPCIVGAGGATDIFKTGDMVRLSGTHGFLERIIVTEKSNEEVPCDTKV